MLSQLNIVKQLIAYDLTIFKRGIVNKLIDVCIMLTTSIIVFSYFMPINSDTSYGPFILIGAIASFGFFEVTGKVSLLSADISGDKTVSYYLTLPMHSYLVFCAFAISWAIEAAILSLVIFPLGKILLFNQLSFNNMSLLYFIPMFISINLFFGFFSLLLASVLKGMRSLSHLWVRILNPMYFFGCYFYPWSKAFSISKLFGYIILINPFVYIMEGIRAAVLGQNGYLPFWLSFIGINIFTLLFAFIGINRLKKRLDFV